MKSVILSMHEDLINNRKTIKDLITSSKKIHDGIKDSNSTLAVNYDDAIKLAEINQAKINQNKDNLLFGIPYSLKDNVSTKEIVTTGGSKFLQDYIPPFNATVYEHLMDSGGLLVSKSNCDEFGLGGTGLHSGFGYVYNVLNHERISGGSSSGSCNEVASGMVAFSIGSDTGDSSRRPATFLGVCGFKPTYGVISRYGVMPYSPSLDHVGVIAKTVTDIAIVMAAIAKYDDKDFTSQKLSDTNFYKNLTPVHKLKFCAFKNIEQLMSEQTKSAYLNVITQIEKVGHTVVYKEVDPLIVDAIGVIYKVITYSEGCSCWANLTGIGFGTNLGGKDFEEIITNNRTNNFMEQIKRRFTIGAYVSKSENFVKIFQRSKKLRTLLINAVNDILHDVDGYIMPGAAEIAPKMADVLANKGIDSKVDDMLLFANFAGLPSISIPVCKIDDMPWGINVTCKQFEDQKTLNIALTLENIFNYDGGSHE